VLPSRNRIKPKDYYAEHFSSSRVFQNTEFWKLRLTHLTSPGGPQSLHSDCRNLKLDEGKKSSLRNFTLVKTKRIKKNRLTLDRNIWTNNNKCFIYKKNLYKHTHTHTHIHSIHSMDINFSVVYTMCVYVGFVSKTHMIMAWNEHC